MRHMCQCKIAMNLFKEVKKYCLIKKKRATFEIYNRQKHIALADPRGGALGSPLRIGPISFIFMQLSAK